MDVGPAHTGMTDDITGRQRNRAVGELAPTALIDNESE
jgi:hypothetical protein